MATMPKVALQTPPQGINRSCMQVAEKERVSLELCPSGRFPRGLATDYYEERALPISIKGAQ